MSEESQEFDTQLKKECKEYNEIRGYDEEC